MPRTHTPVRLATVTVAALAAVGLGLGQVANGTPVPESADTTEPAGTETTAPEPVKPGETTCYADLMSASGVGSLIQATVGSFGGVGRRCPNRAGLAV